MHFPCLVIQDDVRCGLIHRLKIQVWFFNLDSSSGGIFGGNRKFEIKVKVNKTL